MKGSFILILIFFLGLAGRCQILQKDLVSIDHLMNAKRYEEAKLLVEHVEGNLKSSDDSVDGEYNFLELKYRQARILDELQLAPEKTLQILYGIIDRAEKANQYDLCCRIYLLMALSHEKVSNFSLTKKYLDLAFEKIQQYQLESKYSTYCIRRSSYDRYINDHASSFFFAKEAERTAPKWNNKGDLSDAYLILGAYYNRVKDYESSLKYSFLHLNSTREDTITAKRGYQFNNISRKYLNLENFELALLYSDSARAYYNQFKPDSKYNHDKLRSEIFEVLGKNDSALFYYKKFHQNWNNVFQEEQDIKSKNIEERYQSDKQKQTIENKESQVLFITILLLVITLATALVILQNARIKTKNKTINLQLSELSKLLEQKQVLLSELQHRVKNNLQHVISILDIQKESLDFNSIDEIIRENQNRIHSVALLHKKLDVSENVNDVDVFRYVAELADLVISSYDDRQKKISHTVKSDVGLMSIELALPLGLIITELASNSMKHAFKKKNVGVISIEVSHDAESNRYKFNYSDNGIGFDFNATNSKGLGQEIIKGLIDQLDGEVITNNSNGFEITIYF